MPRYAGSLFRTIHLERRIVVTASDEEEAFDKIEEIIENGEFSDDDFDEIGVDDEFDGVVDEVD